MSDFFDDYLNEIHDENIAKNLRNLKKEYAQKQETIQQNAGGKFEMSKAWKNVSQKDSVISTGQELKDLDNDYKQKAMDTAKPGIEDENTFNELAKKHAPDTKKIEPVISSSQEKNLDKKEEARQKFLAQFKENGKDITIERD